jgi:hypothetical protein
VAETSQSAKEGLVALAREKICCDSIIRVPQNTADLASTENECEALICISNA